MKNEIQIWLSEDGSYEDGMLLLAKYGRNPRKLTYLTRRQDLVVLKYALEKLAATVRIQDVGGRTQVAGSVQSFKKKLLPKFLRTSE